MNPNKLLLFFILYSIAGCKKNDTACSIPSTIGTTVFASHPCRGTGSVIITSPLGASYQYKIDDLSYQNQPAFADVKAGKHRLVVKNAQGCETVKEIMIDTVLQGEQFKQVFQILAHRCLSCHAGNNPQAGLNFTNVCDILNHWQRIEARAIQGIPSPMPQAGLIPLAERTIIQQWINTGHAFEK